MFFDKPETQQRLSDTGALGEPSTFAERTIAAFKSTQDRNFGVVNGGAMLDAYEARRKAVMDAVGEDIGNPFTQAMNQLPPMGDANGYGMPGPLPELKPRGQMEADFQSALERLAEKHPDKRDIIAPHKPVRSTFASEVREREQKSIDAGRNYGGITGTGPIADFAGGMGSQVTDPVNAATILIGPTGRVGQGAKAIIGMGVKQGIANAGVEAAMAPLVQDFRRQMGQSYGLGEAAYDIGTAAALGFAADAGIRTAARGIQSKLGRKAILDVDGNVTGYEPAEASIARATRQAESQARAEQLKALQDDGTLQRAMDGDPEAIAKVDPILGLSEDPAVRGARQVQEFVELEPGDFDDIAKSRTFNQALRAAIDADEPPPVIKMERASNRPSLSDDMEIPKGTEGNQHFRTIDIEGKPVHFQNLDPKKITTDAEAMQFKSGGNQFGVTGALGINTTFDPAAAGKVIVFERANGVTIIVDGHQRLSIAKDGDQFQGFVFREKDGWSAADVRAEAAVKNIQEGRANLLDTVRAMREHGPQMEGRIAVDTDFMRQAVGMSRLSDAAFVRLEAGTIEPHMAALVGELVPDQTKHDGVVQALMRANPATEAAARKIIGRETREPVTVEGQTALLGAQDVPDDLITPRSEVLGDVVAVMRQGTPEQMAASLVIERLSDRPGYVSNLLTDAARAIHTGQPKTRVVDAFMRQIEVTAKDGGVEARIAEPPRVERFADPDTGVEMSAGDVDAVIDMTRYVQGMRKVPQPKTLYQWIMSTGRLKDDGGELTTILGGKNRQLISGKGRSLDEAASSAWQAGYMQGERPTVDEFLQLIDRSVRGEKIVSVHDADILEEISVARDMENELEQFGIKPTASADDIRQHFARKGDEGQRRGASPLGGEEEPVRLYSFGGEQARTADTEKLEQAKKLTADGMSREEIWSRTGWFRGVDGKWRFEINDSAAALNRRLVNDIADGKLDDAEAASVLDHPDLYTAYPAFAAMTTQVRKGTADGSFGASVIEVGDRETKPTMLHELQHATQGEEGFARGGNPLMFTAEQIAAERQRLSSSQASPSGWDAIDTLPSPREMSDRQVGWHIYQRIAGEVESRTVEKRQNMTPEERRARPPWLDYDVPEAEQIVRFNDAINQAIRDGSEEPTRLFALSDVSTGRSMRADLDKLGYYSKALEAAKAIPQAKGTPEQMLAALKKAGVKDAEIEATGLRQWLAEKSAAPEIRTAYKVNGTVYDLPGLATHTDVMGSAIDKMGFKTAAESNKWIGTAETQSGFTVGGKFIGKAEAAEKLGMAPYELDSQSQNVSRLLELFPKANSITRDDLVKHLTDNRVGVREALRINAPMDDLLKAFQRYDGHTFSQAQNLANLIGNRTHTPEQLSFSPEVRRISRAVVDALDSSVEAPKFSNYSLDPSNPTYRETVLHLPVERRMPFGEYLSAYRKRFPTSDVPDAEVRSFYDRGVEVPGAGKITSEHPDVFKSGHFSEPNIIGHMMTSMNRHQGKPVYTLDQIQSDWGQKLRDGGVRDEKKIAELKRLKDQTGDQWEAFRIDAEKFAKDSGADPFEYNTTKSALMHLAKKSNDPAVVQGAENRLALWDEKLSEARRYSAEYETESAAAVGNPLVNTTDQWTTTTLRRALRQAVEADAAFIAIPHGDTVLSYNPGDTDGMRGFYGSRTTEGIVPKNLRKLIEKLDPQAPRPVKIETLETSSGPRGWKENGERNFDKSQTGFTLFPITDKVRKSVTEEGQPLFSKPAQQQAPDMAALKSFTENLESVLKDAQKPSPPRLVDDVTGKDGKAHLEDLREEMADDIKGAVDPVTVEARLAAIRAYHGTGASFDKFKSNGIGPHFGSVGQAESRLDAKNQRYASDGGADPSGYFDGSNIIPVDLNMSRVVDLPDMNAWGARQVADALSNAAPDLAGLSADVARILRDGLKRKAHQFVERDANEHIRKTLINNGYDGIKYRNKFEGDGDSYIAVASGTVRSATTGDILFSNHNQISSAASIDLSKPLIYTPEANARMSEIRKEIDRTLQMLPPDVRIRAEDELVFNLNGGSDARIAGLWDGYDRLVYVALSGNDPVRAVRHEVIHALKQSGLLTADEFKQLYAFSETLKLRGAYKIDERYRDLYTKAYGERGGDYVENLLREETIAEMFADYSLNGRRFGDVAGGGLVDRLIDRIVSFMKLLRDNLGFIGFKNVNDIFQAIESGEVASRPSVRNPAGGRNPDVVARQIGEAVGVDRLASMQDQRPSDMINDAIDALPDETATAIRNVLNQANIDEAQIGSMVDSLMPMIRSGDQAAVAERVQAMAKEAAPQMMPPQSEFGRALADVQADKEMLDVIGACRA